MGEYLIMARPDSYFLKKSITDSIQNFLLRIINDNYNSKVSFLQIGANDGSMQDPLFNIIKYNGWSGILVEPVPLFFAQLVENYKEATGLHFVQAACAEAPGILPFYQIRNVDRLPWNDMRGMSSLNRDVLRSHFESDTQFDEFVERVDIPIVTANHILQERGVTKIDVVLIDTEGADWRVVQGFDVEKYQPDVLMVEHLHLSLGDRIAMADRMHRCGYVRCIGVMDTFFFKPDILSRDELDTLASFRTPVLSLR